MATWCYGCTKGSSEAHGYRRDRGGEVNARAPCPVDDPTSGSSARNGPRRGGSSKSPHHPGCRLRVQTTEIAHKEQPTLTVVHLLYAGQRIPFLPGIIYSLPFPTRPNTTLPCCPLSLSFSSSPPLWRPNPRLPAEMTGTSRPRQQICRGPRGEISMNALRDAPR
jgi:hypothetical protein